MSTTITVSQVLECANNAGRRDALFVVEAKFDTSTCPLAMSVSSPKKVHYGWNDFEIGMYRTLMPHLQNPQTLTPRSC
jgi:hypothetical protein